MLLSMALMIGSSIYARDSYNDIVNVLKYVETGNESHLIGDGGDSYGVLQIQMACVNDVNSYWDTSYRHMDMFDPVCAEEVAVLYMRMGAELYQKRYGKEPTEEVLVRNHNGGIYQGYRVNATRKYYKKYLFWKTLLMIRNEI